MKKLIIYIMCVTIVCACATMAAASEETWSIDSATWQDPNNVVLIWDAEEGCSYNVYRKGEAERDYQLIGKTDVGSYRDDNVNYPNSYFYKVENSDKKSVSNPIMSGTNPQKISSVSVIMYHNFITDEDIASGVEFEEYSLKPEDFEADLIWLRDNGYTTITSSDLIEYLENQKSLPPKAVIISIDDGSWGVYKNAWPLLKKYNMKADLNVIGLQIDNTWEMLRAGGTRDGEKAPYCTWEELVKMQESGEINLCSHTYGLHVYNREKRIGMAMIENEPLEDYIKAIQNDYRLSVSCIEGWTGRLPQTVAYPYSKRSKTSDEVILSNTGYKVLMAGAGDRGTWGNYFVEGVDFKNQLKLISRPCRMEGTPIGVYLNNIYTHDFKNGVNSESDTLGIKIEEADKISKDYQMFFDVCGDDWFSGYVYYSYLNGWMRGVSYTEFAPNEKISRGMAATLLHRIAGTPKPERGSQFFDVDLAEWYGEASVWADENGILQGSDDRKFYPYDTICREELAYSMYQCAEYLGLEGNGFEDISAFRDSGDIAAKNVDAIRWAVANKVIKGNGDGTLNPKGQVTRAEMAAVLYNYLSAFAQR